MVCDDGRNGEVTEWFKERAWKVRTPQKGVEGSNPSLSAKGKVAREASIFIEAFFVFIPRLKLA